MHTHQHWETLAGSSFAWSILSALSLTPKTQRLELGTFFADLWILWDPFMESLQALRPVQRCNSSASPRGFQTFRSGCSFDCYNINRNNCLKVTSVQRFCSAALKGDKDDGHYLFILQEVSLSLLALLFPFCRLPA